MASADGKNSAVNSDLGTFKVPRGGNLCRSRKGDRREPWRIEMEERSSNWQVRTGRT